MSDLIKMNTLTKEEYDEIFCGKRVYNADIEEPKCDRCDHMFDDSKCEKCGPEYWWYYYQRTEHIKRKEVSDND